jgi:hypothetical protein
MSTSSEVADYARQIEAIKADASTLVGGSSDEAFRWAPGPDRWSAGQCLEHLNITDRSMLPPMRQAAQRVRAAGRRAKRPTQHSFFMRWFIKDMEPPPKRRYQTGSGFLPAGGVSRARTLAEFNAVHDELLRLLEQVDGFDLSGAKVQSPFAMWLKYKLGSAIALQLAHDRRHLWQAREALEEYRKRE